MMTQTIYHEPVMLKESIDALNIRQDGIYVDVTYGGGGHSKAIIEKLKSGKLFAFDQDQDSEAIKNNDTRLVFINQNFRFLSNYLKSEGVDKIDGLLADLGISSHQIDVNDRGFAFRTDGPLDMRMNRTQDLTAEKVINDYPEADLRRIFRMYGELDNAHKLASIIVSARESSRINTTAQLLDIIGRTIPHKQQHKYLAKIFQALRIEVNGEMEALRQLLRHLSRVVREKGRIAFITYHSLEDRMVKNFIRSGNIEGTEEKDFYGNIIRPFEAVNRKPIYPSEAEMEKNNRARSAKLRVAERVVKNG